MATDSVLLMILQYLLPDLLKYPNCKTKDDGTLPLAHIPTSSLPRQKTHEVLQELAS